MAHEQVSAAVNRYFDIDSGEEPMKLPALKRLTQSGQVLAYLLLQIQKGQGQKGVKPEEAAVFLGLDLQRTREVLSRLKNDKKLIDMNDAGYFIPARNLLLAIEDLARPDDQGKGKKR